MADTFASIDGHRAARALVHVPGRGPWFADVDLEGDPDLSGRVTLALGELELEGTVRASQSGTHGLQRRVQVVAGGDGWGTLLAAKAYHNDSRIRARTVAEDAAREGGEELGDFAPAAERIGIDYVRQSGPASRVLEDVIGGVPWWVGYDGRTHVGARSSSAAAAGSYEVLEHDPRDRVVTLAVDDLRSVVIGSVLSDGLDEPQTVRELELDVGPERVRVRAWCGEDAGFGHLLGLFRAIARRSTEDRLYGLWRYRVVQMSGDRVELQAVRRAAGLPDILPISMWPGIGGGYCEPQGGAEVLVEFIEGDRTMPIVTHFAGKDGVGWEPTVTTLAVTDPGFLRLGSHEAEEKVCLADRIDPRVDSISAALDAFVAAEAVPNDGGAFLQGALSAVWGSSPHEPVDSGSRTVRAVRGALGSIEG
jgi:hypothetical protein